MDKIDEVRPPMKGLYEVRIGTDLFYTDAKGDYVIQGELIDSRAPQPDRKTASTNRTAVNFSPCPERCCDHCARRRQAQGGRVRGPELRLLQAL